MLVFVSTIQTLLDEDERNIWGRVFFWHLGFSNTNIGLCSEDCTVIIPKVTYGVKSDNFVGFPLALEGGRLIADYYQTESLTQFENWFSSVDKPAFLNIHIIQPIVSASQTSNPVILCVCGTNGKYTSFDIIYWWIFDGRLARGIRIIDFPTDVDLKHLKAMKLVSAFFLHCLTWLSAIDHISGRPE